MKQQPQQESRQQVLSRASPELLAELLEAVGHSPSLLNAGLRLTLRVLNAERGLAFDTNGVVVASGFTPEQAQALRQDRLGRLLAGGGVRHYSRPGFVAPADGSAEVVGMAGVISAMGASFVLGVERNHEPFTPTDRQIMVELLRLLARPFEQAAEAMRSERDRDQSQRTITANDLPLNKLDPLPQLRELERLLILEALNRSGNNKTRAAAALGMTREGLRKKLNRYGMNV